MVECATCGSDEFTCVLLGEEYDEGAYAMRMTCKSCGRVYEIYQQE